jgi:hypothetical protein
VSQSSVDPGFGHWLAGFIDGEGSFAIIGQRRRSGTTDYHAVFRLEVRADDTPIVEEIHRRTGIGTIYRRHRQMQHIRDSPQINWQVANIADQLKLVRLLEDHPLRAKKRADFDIWKEAVRLLSCRSHGASNPIAALRLQHRLKELKRELESQRAYREIKQTALPEPDGNGYEAVALFE